MADIKKDSELLAEIYRNAHYALQSISDILPETQDEEMRGELIKMHDGYELISGRAAQLARDGGMELKEPGPFKKAMMWGAIKFNTMKDDSRAHIAEMMTQGTVMGITALTRSIGDAGETCDHDIRKLADDLLKMEQDHEKRMKMYL